MSVEPRLPALAWAHEEAAGRHTTLDWVDSTVEVHRDSYRFVRGADGRVRFQHFPYAAFLPPPMLRAAQAAAARGGVPLIEALLLLLARVEWPVISREWWWTALTPRPHLLAPLVEAYGIERAVHQSHPEVLARLVALLPNWYPTRGSVDAARRLLAAAEMERDVPPTHTAVDGVEPLRDEILTCHATSWWAARRTPGATQELRVTAGVLLFQPSLPAWELRAEDLAITWSPATRLPAELLRLLPPWAVVRPLLSRPPLDPSQARPLESM